MHNHQSVLEKYKLLSLQQGEESVKELDSRILEEMKRIILSPEGQRVELPNDQKQDPALFYRGTTFGLVLFQMYYDRGDMLVRHLLFPFNNSLIRNHGSPLTSKLSLAINVARWHSRDYPEFIRSCFSKLGVVVPKDSYIFQPFLLEFPRSEIKPAISGQIIDFTNPEVYNISSATQECKEKIVGVTGLKRGDTGFDCLYPNRV